MPRIVDKQQKMERIAEAALKVFRESGYPAARMSDIARAAQMGKGTLYEYFRNKADILRFAFERYFEVFTRGISGVMKGRSSASEKLFSLIEFALDHAEQWEDHCAVYVDYSSAARTDKAGRFSLDPLYRTMRRILCAMIQEGQQTGEIDPRLDSTAVAELLISVYDGLILRRMLRERARQEDSGLLKQTVLEILRSGLRPQTRPRGGKHGASSRHAQLRVHEDP